MISLVFFHGWGFDSGFWVNLSKYFRKFQLYFFDRDYFSRSKLINPNITMLTENDWIAITHSYGLVILLELIEEHPKIKKKLKGVISISGFVHFTKDENNPYGTTKTSLETMIRQFSLEPIPVLKSFYRSCNFRDNAYSSSIKEIRASALDELKKLISVNKTSSLKNLNIPVLFLAALDDEIVSFNISLSMQKGLFKAKFKTIEKAGHALGYTESEWCYENINSFVRGIYGKDKNP